MLSEEEKKAIERLKERINDSEDYKTVQVWLTDDVVAVNTVLNLITKLQKENEDLQREKEENKLIIAMANNEMLGYNQGYSDGKNQNSNATEIIIKNRQAYMHKEEVEFYKRKIEFLKKENEEKDKQIDLMAEVIDELSEYYTRYNGKNNEFCKEVCIKKDIDCIDCIKQYFETKAKKGK